MAQGPVKDLPAELGAGPAVSAADICLDSADLEFATSVANVRLRTVEDAWSLPRLGCSARVAPITTIWK